MDTTRPSPRINWTRLVPHPVSTGHVSSLTPYQLDTSLVQSRLDCLLRAASERRMWGECAARELGSAQLRWVPSDYYARALDERARIVGAPSAAHLCKTIVRTPARGAVAAECGAGGRGTVSCSPVFH